MKTFPDSLITDYKERRLTLRELVDIYGTCPATISFYLAKKGVKKNRGARGKWLRADIPAILAKFDAGETLERIGEAHGITRERVRQIAQQHKRKARGRYEFTKHKRSLQLFRMGKNIEEISRQLGACRETIARALKKQGAIIPRATRLMPEKRYAIKRFPKGTKPETIARALNMKEKTVRAILAQLGR